MSVLHKIQGFGQSVWLNYLRRAFLESGELSDLLSVGISGITSSPALFAKAITHSADYDQVLQQQVAAGMPVKSIFEALLVDDMQRAADCLHPAHERSGGLDGFVSMELDPAWMYDAMNMVAEAQRLLRAVDRSNVMIEIPATEAGFEAIQALTADGVSINVTHIFAVEQYELASKAYTAGLETFVKTHSAWRIAPSSVASFSLNRIDSYVDALLKEAGLVELCGLTAIALAKVAYGRYQALFQGPQWEALAKFGARPLRLKWTRLTPRQFHYDELHYVLALIGPDTVTTLSPATLNALREHAAIAPTLENWMQRAPDHLAQIKGSGIDLAEVARALQRNSLAAYDRQFQELINSVGQKRQQLEEGWQRLHAALGEYEPIVDKALQQVCERHLIRRLWAEDVTLWPQKKTNGRHLGWLKSVTRMQENAPHLLKFTRQLRQDGFTSVLIVGMGHAVTAGDVLVRMLGQESTLHPWRRGHEALFVRTLDTIDPAAVRQQVNQLNMQRTLVVLAGKTGMCRETQALARYLAARVGVVVGDDAVSSHFAAITTRGSWLANWASTHNLRNIFYDDPAIDEAFAALSYFGLVPAALAGVDVLSILDQALAMQGNASSCNWPTRGDNMAAQLGTILAILTKAGRNKLTLILSPSVLPFGHWVARFVATGIGKQEQGIVPIVEESVGEPAVYGADRFFVHVRLRGEGQHDAPLAAIQAAGHPLVTIHLTDPCELGGWFFVWEMALAVAAVQLHVNPFTQPQLAFIESQTSQVLANFAQNGSWPLSKAAPISWESLDTFLSKAESGDFVALQVFAPRSVENDRVLGSLQCRIRDRYQLATTVDYEPASHHTNSLLHNGGAKGGHFVQFIGPMPVPDEMIPTARNLPPDAPSFGALQRAQALAVRGLLREQGRPFMRFYCEKGIALDVLPLVD